MMVSNLIKRGRDWNTKHIIPIRHVMLQQVTKREREHRRSSDCLTQQTEGSKGNRVTSRECELRYQGIHREAVSDFLWTSHQVV